MTSTATTFPYKIESIIESGTFGKVYVATDNITHEQVAVKLVPKGIHDISIQRELMALRSIPPHPGIISLLYPLQSIHHETEMCAAFIFPYFHNGNMFDYIEKNGPLSEPNANRWSRQILEALKFAHSVHIYHRDIKLENILIGSDMQPVLCDWGMSIKTNKPVIPTTMAGSTMYIAPELFTHNMYSPAKADVWSAMCAIFMMYTKHPPFLKALNSDWYFNHLMYNPDVYWSSVRKFSIVSTSFQEMVSMVFKQKESARASMDTLLECPWLKLKHE